MLEGLFEGKDVEVVLANAGCGKTTYLVKQVMKELSFRRPEEVAFITFTRKGVEEGKQRVCSSAKVKRKDLPYFRTLHSLAYGALHMDGISTFDKKHERKFNEEYGYSVQRDYGRSGQLAKGDGGQHHNSEDAKYLDLYDAVRSKFLSTKAFVQMNVDMRRYSALVRSYEQYKKDNSLVDFCDCLLKYVEEGESLPCKAVFIDECQDITALQWAVIQKAFKQAERIVMAGDEKQCIYGFCGARPDFLVEASKRFPVTRLAVSYRLPREVYRFSDAVSKFISNKAEYEASFREANGEGVVARLPSLSMAASLIDTSSLFNSPKSQWYILARNSCFLDRAFRELEERLVPYWTADGFFMDEALSKIDRYSRYEAGADDGRKEEFMRKYCIDDFSRPFTECSLFEGERRWVYMAYIERYELSLLKDMRLWSPCVLASTVHHVKGGEAENVIFMMDATRRSYNERFSDLDSELDILYVAATRARRNLYLIDSAEGKGFDDIVDAVMCENGM